MPIYHNENHLCSSCYGTVNVNRCEHLRYVQNDDEMYGKKKLDRFCVYCMAEGRCRKIGHTAQWTGCSPTWCPKRKEAAGGSETERDRDGRADPLDAGHTAEA